MVNQALRAARLASGLSQAQLAESVNYQIEQATGRPGTLDANTVSRLERGAIARPAQRTVDGLCAVLAATETELGFERSQAEREPIDAALVAGKVSPEALDAMAGALASTRILEDTTNSATVLPAISGLVAVVDIYAHHAPLRLREQTLTLASELHCYGGWLRMDNHQDEHAVRDFNAAIAQGVEVGSADHTSHALSFKGYTALRRGRYGEAATLSRSDSRTFTALVVFDAYQRSWALTKAGEHADADRAMADGDRLLDTVPDAPRPSWAYWYDVPFLLTQRALVHRAAGRVEHAIADLQAGLAEMPAAHREAQWSADTRQLLDELSA